jgi:ABC-type glycerol-3-phosphate transport system substrate-binding protein
MSRRLGTGFAGAGLAFCLLLTGCGGDDDETSGDEASGEESAGDENSIDVILSEWAVEAPATVTSGSVTVNAINEGGETHELVIVRADSPDEFVVDDTGKVDEAGFAEEDFIGEIEEFDAGTTETGTFELTPGTYVLFCNIVEEEEDGEFESHFQEGMVTTITVS